MNLIWQAPQEAINGWYVCTTDANHYLHNNGTVHEMAITRPNRAVRGQEGYFESLQSAQSAIAKYTRVNATYAERRESAEIRFDIISNFIDHFTSSEEERLRMKDVATEYIDHDEADELETLMVELQFYKNEVDDYQAVSKSQSEIFQFSTGMGKIFIDDREDLYFLTDGELNELDSIGYSGKTLDGALTTREIYLNTLNKGNITVKCTKRDNGDYQETYEIIRII